MATFGMQVEEDLKNATEKAKSKNSARLKAHRVLLQYGLIGDEKSSGFRDPMKG